MREGYLTLVPLLVSNKQETRHPPLAKDEQTSPCYRWRNYSNTDCCRTAKRAMGAVLHPDQQHEYDVPVVLLYSMFYSSLQSRPGH